jgi:hypothetical protein
MFAIKNYDNPQADSEKEFYDDMKRFKYLKRLLKRFEMTGNLKERLIINHIIVLSNVFGTEAAKVLLLFKVDRQYWTILKSFLSYLNMLGISDMTEIQSNEKVTETLKRI